MPEDRGLLKLAGSGFVDCKEVFYGMKCVGFFKHAFFMEVVGFKMSCIRSEVMKGLY